MKNAVRISSSLSCISHDLWYVWDGGHTYPDVAWNISTLQPVLFLISLGSVKKLRASYWESGMLQPQGLDIPWGVMVGTWDLTFSSTSDVPDRLDLCSTV